MMAKSDSGSNIDRLAEHIRAGLESEVNSATATDATEAILSDTEPPQSVSAAPPADIPPQPVAPPEPNLADFIKDLSPEQLSKVRALATSRGIAAGPKHDINGNLLVEIRIDKDLIPALEAWSEQSGYSLKEQIQEIADYLFPGYLIGGSGTPEIITAPVDSTTGAARP